MSRGATHHAARGEPEETTMLRKLSIVAVAAASLGAALAPTSASAGWHNGPHGHHGWGWGAPRFYVGGPAYGYGGCYVPRLVPTPWGPPRGPANRCHWERGANNLGAPLAPRQSLLLRTRTQ